MLTISVPAHHILTIIVFNKHLTIYSHYFCELFIKTNIYNEKCLILIKYILIIGII